MLRILHLLPTVSFNTAQRSCRSLVDGLSGDSFEQHVYRDLGCTHRLDLAAAGRLRRQLQTDEAQIVHVWDESAWPTAILATRGHRRTRCVLSVDHQDRADVRLGCIERRLAARTAAIVGTSLTLAETLIARGWPVEKVQTIAPGVDNATTVVPVERRLRTVLELPAEMRLVGAAARFVAADHVKDLIWAADLLKVVRDDVHLVLFGAGPQRRRLEKFRQQVRIDDRVHFVGPESDAAQHLSELDVYWHSRTQPGLSQPVLDALAAAIPVVAFDTPDARSLIEPEVSGLLVPRGGRAALAAATQRVIDDAALARSLGQAGRDRVLATFSTQRLCEHYAALYRQLRR